MHYNEDLWLWLQNYDQDGKWIENGLARELSKEGKQALKEITKKDIATMDHNDMIRYARLFNIAFSGLSRDALTSTLKEKVNWLSRFNLTLIMFRNKKHFHR